MKRKVIISLLFTMVFMIYTKIPVYAMQVYVVTPTDTTIVLEVEPNTTIYELRELIYSETGVDPENQKLIWANKELDNEHTFADYNISKESTIHLSIIHNHDYVLVYNNEMHWEECLDVDCGEKENEEEHIFTNDWLIDSVEHWKECTCRYRAFVSPHNLGDWIVDSIADESKNGSRHKECDECNQIMQFETIYFEKPIEHVSNDEPELIVEYNSPIAKTGDDVNINNWFIIAVISFILIGLSKFKPSYHKNK